jgi:hypothetical protein
VYIAVVQDYHYDAGRLHPTAGAATEALNTLRISKSEGLNGCLWKTEAPDGWAIQRQSSIIQPEPALRNLEIHVAIAIDLLAKPDVHA